MAKPKPKMPPPKMLKTDDMPEQYPTKPKPRPKKPKGK